MTPPASAWGAPITVSLGGRRRWARPGVIDGTRMRDTPIAMHFEDIAIRGLPNGEVARPRGTLVQIYTVRSSRRSWRNRDGQKGGCRPNSRSRAGKKGTPG